MMVSGSSRAARELLSVVVRTGWVAHTTLSKLLDFGATEKTINQIRLAAPQSNLPSIFSTVGVHHPEKKEPVLRRLFFADIQNAYFCTCR